MATQQQRHLKVLIVGDSCVDVYHYGICTRLSPEAPVPVFKLSHTEKKEGMALNVAQNLRAFGVEVEVITNPESITKERFIDLHTKSHLLRFDTGESQRLAPLSSRVIEGIDFSLYDAIAIVDYNKGFLNKAAASALSAYSQKADIPLFVDSKKQDLSPYNNSIIKINAAEAAQVADFPETYELITTMGASGAHYNDILYTSDAVEVYDVCGAGDTFFGALIYEYIMCQKLEEAVKFANKCARVTVTKSGVYALSKEDIKNVNLC
tara:strand:- start:124 stop:918 length:795 start_codon:yes stop_codon:yes gene_type:complete